MITKTRKKILSWTIALLFVAAAGGATVNLAVPSTVLAATPCNDTLLTLPAWFKGLTDADCNIKSPDPGPDGLQVFVWTIALNILDAVLQIIGYISIGFIIRGGFKYITSSGSPEGISSARKIILNAVIGLIISLFSIAIVNIIARSF